MRLIHYTISLMAAGFLASPVLAQHIEGGEEEIPNVLVVKIPGDQSKDQSGQFGQDQDQDQSGQLGQDQDQGQDQKGATMTNGALMIPLNIEIPMDKSGQVDLDKLADLVAQHEPTAQAYTLTQQQMADDDIPDAVKQAFANGEGESERLAWRYWYPRRYGYSGFYGYSRYPTWGYHYRYPTYYPRYGYYYGGRTYPYRFGRYRYYNGWGYNYYYRW